MTNLQAALGVAQMERIDEVIRIKRRNTQLYNSLLEGVPGIVLPPEAPWAKRVYWLHTILLEERSKIKRDRVIKEFDRRGIETRPVFYPMSSMPPYRNGKDRRFPVAERISRNGLSLPSSPLLKPDHIRRVCGVLRELSEGL
jgi:perosamine synthetase